MMVRKNVLTSVKKKKAVALIQARQLRQAKELYQQVCKTDPADADAWFMLGTVHGLLGEPNEAMSCCRRATTLDPNHSQAYYNLATAHKDLGQSEAAIAAYRQALRCKPDYVEAWDGLGFALMSTGHIDDAIAAYRELLRRRPKDAKAYANLGSCLQAQGRLEEAANACREALKVDPANAGIHDKLGCVLCEQGLYGEAMNSHRKALAIAPNDVIAHSNLLLTMHYLPGSNPDELFAEHRSWGQSQANVAPVSITHHANIRDPERRLRVGYVSSDFRAHSVAFFLEPLLTNHNRAVVETVCYSGVANPDATTERLRKTAGQWRDIGRLNDEQAVNMIRTDGIDILVDLAGHTGGSRLRVFARKPAPIQITYLGYPDTTGLDVMDYRFTDALADPEGADRYYTEKLIRLPRGFLCYRPLEDSPAVSPLPARTKGFVTFGSFNNLSKINSRVIDLWVRLLREVPDARLFIKNPSLTDTFTREHYYGLFEQRGIGRDRVELRGRTATQAEHLALYSHIDIGLDTFPYNGTTTTCEALWMGVPVITLSGLTHAGRVGRSLLTSAGLREFVAHDAADYVARAAALAGDIPSLSALRAGLRDGVRASSLCDAATFARNFETALREMWRRWCGGMA